MNEFPETADIETSSEDYAKRFEGPAGEWMLSLQEKIVIGWLAGFKDISILDVGGGHGQLALPISSAGFDVTVIGSSEECVGRIKEQVDAGDIEFDVDNVLDMAYVDDSYDVVVSIRLLPHCERWPELISELCRVAEKAVIVDYPTHQSLNCFSAFFFGLKKKMEGNTRPYKLFGNRQITKEFAKNGYKLAAIKKEFFVPMVIHRKLNSPKVSSAIEKVCRALGLTYFFGSPVLARFEPK